MTVETRTSKSVKNSKVALLYFIFVFAIGFFSRRVFLEHLGAEVLGLNTTAVNLLQFINLAELGIGTAIASTLYKPLFGKDIQTINEIVSLQGWLYRRIAYIVMIVAVILICFFPIIFNNSTLPVWYAYSTFSVLLFSSLLGYFVNYKQVILSANQQEYLVVCSYKSVINILKGVFQIIAISYFSNGYVWWLVLEVCFAIIASLTLNRTIKKAVPYLKTDISRGKELAKKYPDVTKKIKQLFFHKMGGYSLTQLQPLIIYAFTSLIVVAYYGNYLFIITGLTILMNALFNGIGASVGHLIAEGNKNRILSLFEELYSSRFLLTSILCISTYYLSPLFISLWLGEEYIMDNSTLLLMLISFFIIGIRGAVDNYLAAYGLFSDTWAPVVEILLNITLSILLGSIWGLNGVLIGTIISLLIIILGWKPYFLFIKGLKVSYIIYLKIFIKHIFVIGLIVGILSLIEIKLPLVIVSNKYLNFIWNALIVFTSSLVTMSLLLSIVSRGMRSFTKRVYKILFK